MHAMCSVECSVVNSLPTELNGFWGVRSADLLLVWVLIGRDRDVGTDKI